jgi:hypothetical protein
VKLNKKDFDRGRRTCGCYLIQFRSFTAFDAVDGSSTGT